jgi:hypothetical protein
MTMPHTDLAKMYYFIRGCRGRDRMIVGFTTTYAISTGINSKIIISKKLSEIEQNNMFVGWCLTPFPTIFQLYRGCQFYWWRKLEDPK